MSSDSYAYSYEAALRESDVMQGGADEDAVKNILQSLWLRRRLLAIVVLTVLVISTLLVYQLTPRYTATTQILIGIKAQKVVNIQEVVSEISQDDKALLSEIEVLKSRELAHKVINSLHLEQYSEFNPELKRPGFLDQYKPSNWIPDSWKQASGSEAFDTGNEEDAANKKRTALIDAFLSKLTVTPIRGSQVITVAYESLDPKLAARIANAIADKYIVGQLEAKFEATKKATDWLNDQLADLKQKVEDSEFAVEQYRKEHNLIEVGKDLGVNQQQLNDINGQLIAARTLRAEAEAKYQQVETIARSGGDIDSVVDVLNSPLISSLRTQEAEIERKYSEMLVEYGPRHPKMVQMHAEIEDIKKKMRADLSKITATLRNAMDLARARERALEGSLRQLTGMTSRDNHELVQLRTLERESAANRAMFETFLGRFKETSSTQGIEQAEARVISKAEVPLGPSFPDTNKFRLLSVVISLLIGLIVVVVVEMLNPGVRSPEQIQQLFNLPTLGLIPLLQEEGESIQDYLITKPQSALAEAINTLRISLSLLNPDDDVKTVLITSSVPSEGKSTLSAMLARYSAKSGQKVVLIETDLRKPAIGKAFGYEKGQLGLTDLMSNHDLTLEDVLIEDAATGLMFLLRGKAGYINPVDLFASKRMRNIIKQLRERFDLVIMDSAPVMAVPDSRVLSHLVDKTLFVINWDSTPKKVISSALHLLERDGKSNVVGSVIQKINMRQYGRYGYYDSGHYYHYGRYNNYYHH